MIILYVIVALIVVVLLIAALMPKSFELRADTIINVRLPIAWEYVKSFANQKEYSVRVMADPNVKLTYTGTDGTIGATQSRDSQDKNVWAWEQELMKLEESEDDMVKSMEVEIRFTRPMVATNFAKTIFEDVWHGHTKVTNVFRWVNSWPGNLLSSFFLPKVQKDMQKNMNNLKEVLEKKTRN